MRQPAKHLSSLMELGLALEIATLAFALPLYDRLYASPGTVELVRLIVVAQVLPTGIIFAFARVLSLSMKPRWLGRLFWAGCHSLAVLSMFRLAQLNDWGGVDQIERLPSELKLATVLLAIVFLLSGALAMSSKINRVISSVSPVAIVISLYFFAELTMSGASRASAATPMAPSASVRDDTVFIMIFDELGRRPLQTQDGQLDATTFPNLAALAAEGIWFSKASSNYAATCQSIPSLLSSRRVGPEEKCSDFMLLGRAPNLLTQLAGEYQMSVYEEYFRDCPTGSLHTCRGIPYLTANYPQIALAQHLIPNSVRRGLLADWLGDTEHQYTWTVIQSFLDDITAARARGRVYFLHVLMPHTPFEYDASGRRHHSPYQGFVGRPEHDALTYRNYYQQVILTDVIVGEIVDKIKAEGLYPRSTIVITGDHGPRTADGFMGSAFPNEISDWVPAIPLVIRSAGLQPGVISIDYQHVDFAPTLLDLLRVKPWGELAGVSAFAEIRPARSKQFAFGGRYEFREESGRWILVEPAVEDRGSAPAPSSP